MLVGKSYVPPIFLPTTFARLVAHATGESFRAVAVVEQLDMLTPGEGEVLIKVLFAGINGGCETFRARGEHWFAANQGRKGGFLLGAEGAGIIAALGPGVTDLKIGQHVACNGGNAFSEYTLAKATSCTPVARATAEIVAVTLSGLTAIAALEGVALMKAGETVLVTAAAGGTGQFAVQLAKIAGCHVIAVAGGPVKAEVLRGFGADRVVDYTCEAERIACPATDRSSPRVPFSYRSASDDPPLPHAWHRLKLKRRSGPTSRLTSPDKRARPPLITHLCGCDLERVLYEHYPNGIDVVYEGVGGSIRDTLIRNLAPDGRLLQVGYISEYPHNPAPPPPPPPPPVIAAEPAVEEAQEVSHTPSEAASEEAHASVTAASGVAEEEASSGSSSSAIGKGLQAGCVSSGKMLQATYSAAAAAAEREAVAALEAAAEQAVVAEQGAVAEDVAAVEAVDPLLVSDKLASVQAPLQDPSAAKVTGDCRSSHPRQHLSHCEEHRSPIDEKLLAPHHTGQRGRVRSHSPVSAISLGPPPLPLPRPDPSSQPLQPSGHFSPHPHAHRSAQPRWPSAPPQSLMSMDNYIVSLEQTRRDMAELASLMTEQRRLKEIAEAEAAEARRAAEEARRAAEEAARIEAILVEERAVAAAIAAAEAQRLREEQEAEAQRVREEAEAEAARVLAVKQAEERFVASVAAKSALVALDVNGEPLPAPAVLFWQGKTVELVGGRRILGKIWPKDAATTMACKARLFSLYDAGHLTPRIDTSRTFVGVASIPDAVDHMLTGKHFGKVVVEITHRAEPQL
ncbi:MAG: hypothetical protein WDW38_007408 [Sanguina aurantia]